MIVCIAEKPSVARDIAKVIGANQAKDGYMEGNGYHIRMKGISNDSIMHYCKNNEITPFELYKKLRVNIKTLQSIIYL